RVSRGAVSAANWSSDTTSIATTDSFARW
ncbi:hypothetical protein GCK32_022794, partial [Trichostrongylus colubriformis]